MLTRIFRYQRPFQIWGFSVGHGVLLLRSAKSEGAPTRIDVLFKNVGAIHLPSLMDDLEVLEASADEKAKLPLQLPPSRMLGRRVFIVKGATFEGAVVAALVEKHEDKLEYNEPSHFRYVLPDGPTYLW